MLTNPRTELECLASLGASLGIQYSVKHNKLLEASSNYSVIIRPSSRVIDSRCAILASAIEPIVGN